VKKIKRANASARYIQIYDNCYLIRKYLMKDELYKNYFKTREEMMSEVRRPHRLRQAYGDRWESEAKKKTSMSPGAHRSLN
jgi:hypothetical protein